jgi:chemotaxis protein MotB
VVELLVAEGMPGAQLGAEGFGEFRALAPNDTEAGRTQNRRVVLVIHAPDPSAEDAQDAPAAAP